MSNVSQWSTTDASNNSAPPDGAPESTTLVSDLNDIDRAVMGGVARLYEHLDGSLVTAGSSNAFTIDTASDHAALADQSVIIARADRAPTGAATLQVDSLAAKSIKINHNEDVDSSTWAAGQMLVFVYDATDDVYEVIGPSIPADGAITTAKLANSAVTEAKISTFPLPRGYLGGLGMSNGTDTDHDIDIAAGTAREAGDGANLTISSTHTKRIDASWASGSGNGGLASAVSLSVTTWYHVFLVDDGNGNTEAGFDTSLTATNLLSDTGGSYYRRIGSVLTDGSSNILAFTQSGDHFLWTDPPRDMNNASIGSSSRTLGTASSPTGVRTILRLNAYIGNSGVALYVSSPDANDEAVSTSSAPLASVFNAGSTAAGYVEVLTNTSSQFGVRASSGSSNTVRVVTLGYKDRRGRDD